MSLKLCIVLSFLLIQLSNGQNTTFFGLFSLFDDLSAKSNETALIDTAPKPNNQTEILNDGVTVSTNIKKQETTTTPKSEGWNYFIPSFDLNGFPASLVKPTLDLKKLALMLITRTHCNDVREHRVCKYTQNRYGVTETKALLKDPDFDVNRKTVIYFHGYDDYIESEATQLIIDAYLQRDDHNLFVCDYRELVSGNYLKNAVANIQIMAPAIANMIYTLNGKGFDLSLLHLVGHAIGAQMAGSIGRAFIDLTDGTKLIERITGLDPSFAFFYPPIGRHITSKDAYFVDIIHSDAWSYGAPVATGTVDFWPNGGSNTQPGCPPRDRKLFSKIDVCSHYRSVRFWAESLLSEHAFLSMKCSSWKQFKKNECSPKSLAYMGCNAKPGISGNYYLQTNGQEPFSRKHHGIIYDLID